MLPKFKKNYLVVLLAILASLILTFHKTLQETISQGQKVSVQEEVSYEICLGQYSECETVCQNNYVCLQNCLENTKSNKDQYEQCKYGQIMGSYSKWPQISGPALGQDVSYDLYNQDSQFIGFETPINIFDVEKYLTRITPENLRKEFALIRNLSEQHDHFRNFEGANETFKALNRYSNVLPSLDRQSIVKVNDLPLTAKNYVNGCYISSVFGNPKAFIAAQGPLESGTPAFWESVWYNNVSLIVMLCQLQDLRWIQCFKYWPERTITYGKIIIKSQKPQYKEGAVVERVMNITFQGQTRQVTHLWISWPDHGIPDKASMKPIDYILDKMHINVQQNKPVVVHCSAGVGRTGTLITLYQIKSILNFYENDLNLKLSAKWKFEDCNIYKQQQVKKDTRYSLSIFSIVRRLREQRMLMVTMEDQYKYCYDYAIEKINKMILAFK